MLPKSIKRIYIYYIHNLNLCYYAIRFFASLQDLEKLKKYFDIDITPNIIFVNLFQNSTWILNLNIFRKTLGILFVVKKA